MDLYNLTNHKRQSHIFHLAALNKTVRAEVIRFISLHICAVVSVFLYAIATCPQVGGLARTSNVDARSNQRNMWPRGVLALGGAGDIEDMDIEIIRRNIHGNK